MVQTNPEGLCQVLQNMKHLLNNMSTSNETQLQSMDRLVLEYQQSRTIQSQSQCSSHHKTECNNVTASSEGKDLQVQLTLIEQQKAQLFTDLDDMLHDYQQHQLLTKRVNDDCLVELEDTNDDHMAALCRDIIEELARYAAVDHYVDRYQLYLQSEENKQSHLQNGVPLLESLINHIKCIDQIIDQQQTEQY